MNLKVAYVLGDNILEEIKDVRKNGLPPHLDSDNSEVKYDSHTFDLLEKQDKPIVSANVYLGAREILRGLQEGADIIICGRVADASPVSGHGCDSHVGLTLLMTWQIGYWRCLVLACMER